MGCGVGGLLSVGDGGIFLRLRLLIMCYAVWLFGAMMVWVDCVLLCGLWVCWLVLLLFLLRLAGICSILVLLLLLRLMSVWLSLRWICMVFVSICVLSWGVMLIFCGRWNSCCILIEDCGGLFFYVLVWGLVFF